MDYKFINTEYLDSVSGGDREITHEIIKMFSEQTVEIYGEMKSLLASGKYHLLGMLAHKAKSSVAIMGMNDLSLMLKTFELQAKEARDTELYEGYIERFRRDTDSAIIELNDFKNKL
jgi:HPt (histidine-containing phosphotransfer) domain-containing protein